MRLKPHVLKQQRKGLQLRERTGPLEEMNQVMLVRRIALIEQPTMVDTLGRERMGMPGPTRDKVRTQQFFSGAVKNRPVPKFPRNEDEAAMWHLRFRAHLDGMGLGYTLDHAATPVPVKGDQRDLILRYGEQPVQHAQAAWACLLDATAGAAFEERVLSAVTVRNAWCQILSWAGPSSEAETFFLERQLETVPNYGDENPKLFFSRVDQ